MMFLKITKRRGLCLAFAVLRLKDFLRGFFWTESILDRDVEKRDRSRNETRERGSARSREIRADEREKMKPDVAFQGSLNGPSKTVVPAALDGGKFGKNRIAIVSR